MIGVAKDPSHAGPTNATFEQQVKDRLVWTGVCTIPQGNKQFRVRAVFDAGLSAQGKLVPTSVRIMGLEYLENPQMKLTPGLAGDDISYVAAFLLKEVTEL